ncbi:MAG: hypothetical protein D4R57_00760 [Verrucomicrobiales bacterium]|nr:MAG: hypothetical protein D4R57_00760 [Verrucomicrobiales bacterium]
MSLKIKNQDGKLVLKTKFSIPVVITDYYFFFPAFFAFFFAATLLTSDRYWFDTRCSQANYSPATLEQPGCM